ncbi:MAG: hypothetical protein ACKOF7_03205 [Phycisphaerales bacterium]
MNIGGKLLAKYGARRRASSDGEPARDAWIPSWRWVAGGAVLLCGGLAGIVMLVVAGWDSWQAARVAVRCCLGFTTIYVSWRVVAYLITPGYDRTLDWFGAHAGPSRVTGSFQWFRPIASHVWIHSNFADFRYAPIRCALNLLAVAAPIASLLVASHWSRVRFGQSWLDRRRVPGRAFSELIELRGASGSAPGPSATT